LPNKDLRFWQPSSQKEVVYACIFVHIIPSLSVVLLKLEEVFRLKYGKFFVLSFLLCLITGMYAYADQVIYIEISQFDPGMSEFGVDVLGNTWVETIEDGAINGTAFGAPGDNDHGAGGGRPALVFKVPVDVKAGEGTSDGKTWAAWARFYMPEALITVDGFNSFFMRSSTDAENWTPATGGDTALRWNDVGAMFPASINGVDILLTDVGERLPWFWQKHTANGQSTIDPVMEAGVNYIEVGPRESDAVKYPRIDVICLRNDDGLPSDAEAPLFLTAVQPADKLSTSWGHIKSDY